MDRHKYTKKNVLERPTPVEPDQLELESFRVRGNSLGAHITNVLPEVWEEILNQLSSDDYLSLINSSPLLRSQLKDEKILLPMILSFLVTGRFIGTHQAFLDLRKWYPVTKQAIDVLLKEEYSPVKYWETITTRDLEWTEWVGDDSLKLRYICHKVQQVYNHQFQLKVQRHLEQEQLNLLTNFNPFLAGYLHVKLDSISPDNHESFLNFMSQYGHHIVHLKCSKLRDIQLLFLLLPHLKNLKVLKLYTKEKVQQQDRNKFTIQSSLNSNF